MYYYLIFNNIDIESNYNIEIKNTISNYYGKITEEIIFSKNNFVIIIKNEKLRNDLEEFLTNFIVDNFLKLKVYQSNIYNSLNSLKEEVTIKNNVFLLVSENTKQFVHTDKSLIESYLKKEYSLDFKKMILKDYYNDYEMIRTIKGFIDSNLNAVITSKNLNIHRNTLNYRLTKFYEKTGYDVKTLKDAFIINQILN